MTELDTEIAKAHQAAEDAERRASQIEATTASERYHTTGSPLKPAGIGGRQPDRDRTGSAA